MEDTFLNICSVVFKMSAFSGAAFWLIVCGTGFMYYFKALLVHDPWYFYLLQG